MDDDQTVIFWYVPVMKSYGPNACLAAAIASERARTATAVSYTHLNNWKKMCWDMGIPLDGDTVYSLSLIHI